MRYAKLKMPPGRSGRLKAIHAILMERFRDMLIFVFFLIALTTLLVVSHLAESDYANRKLINRSKYTLDMCVLASCDKNFPIVTLL